MEEKMPNAQEFCLRWNNFHSSLVSALDGFKNDEDFVDVTLACEGQFLKAHKMLLSACSVFFRDLLKANPCQHPIVILPPEVKFNDLEKLLRFIYQGEVNVQQENLARFLKTAEMLKIRGLAEDNDKMLRSSPRPPDTGDPPNGSPKRPRLSTEIMSAGPQTPHSHNDDSRLSGGDSDSEMIPVKQEMVVEFKDNDAMYEGGESEPFSAEAYLREGGSTTSSSQPHPPPPPPPGPLIPSYVPPPQVKSQDDSLQGSHLQDEITQGFEMSRTFDLIAAGALSGQYEAGEVPGGIAGIFEGMGGGVPWRRPGGGVGDGGQQQDDGYVACPQCHKPITSYNLNRHVKMVHSTMERATCTLCNKQFKNKYSLATHVHRQHSEHAHGGQGGVHRQPSQQHQHIFHQQTQRQTSQSVQPQLSSPQRHQHQQQALPQRPHPSQNTEHPQQISPQQHNPRPQQSSGPDTRTQTTAILAPSQRTQQTRLQHHHRLPSPTSGATATVMQRSEEMVKERH